MINYWLLTINWSSAKEFASASFSRRCNNLSLMAPTRGAICALVYSYKLATQYVRFLGHMVARWLRMPEVLIQILLTTKFSTSCLQAVFSEEVEKAYPIARLVLGASDIMSHHAMSWPKMDSDLDKNVTWTVLPACYGTSTAKFYIRRKLYIRSAWASFCHFLHVSPSL